MGKVLNICCCPVLRTALTDILEQADHRVLEASSAFDGIQQMDLFEPDVVIVDGNLTGNAALEVCRQVRSIAAAQQACVLLLSNDWSDRDKRIEALEAGVDAVLALPVVAKEMMLTVDALVGQRSRAPCLNDDGDTALMQKVIEQLPIGVVVVDAQSRRTIVCNKQVHPIWGRALDEGFRPDGEKLLQQEWPLIRSITAGKPILGEEIRIDRGNGSQGFISVSAAPIRNDAGRVIAGVLIFDDITERKRSEAALRESEERFLLAAKATGDAIWDWNVRTGDMWWNDASFEVFGERPGDWQSSGQWWMDRLHPDEQAGVLAHGKAALAAEGQSTWVTEYRFRKRDGSYAEIVERAFIVRDRGGVAMRVVGAMLDLTERKHVETELKNADRRKNEFLTMLAHELRNPLAPVRNALRVIQRLSGEDPKLSRACELINMQVEHMGRLVDDLLNVSKIAQGVVALRQELLRVNDVVMAALDVAKPLIEAHFQQLVLEIPDTNLCIEGDPIRLKQALSNVLINASKYSEDGGKIQVRVHVENAMVVVSVQDNGLGIAKELLPHVFELYVRGAQEQDRAQTGLGVGLSLVRKLVDLHGGTVEARSEGLGCGSEFLIKLPMANASKSTDSEDREAASDPTPVRVLLVEDNVFVSESFAMALEIEGFEVHTSMTGEDGLDVAKAFQPQAVVVDLNLPGMDGYAVARLIRQAWAGRAILLIGLSGASPDKSADLSAFDHCLLKPVPPASIAQLINHSVGLQR